MPIILDVAVEIGTNISYAYIYSHFRQLKRNKEAINRLVVRFQPLFNVRIMLYVNSYVKIFLIFLLSSLGW